MEFAIAFTAPSLPISICSGRGDVGPEMGGVLYYVEVFQFLLNKAVMHLGGKEY